MAIRILECPSCGGDIDFYDETKLFGRCTSCGKAVQRTEPEKIIVQGNVDDSDQLLKQGMEHVELGHFSMAQEIFTGYIKKNPKRYEGYYGMLLALTDNLSEDFLDHTDSKKQEAVQARMNDIRKLADPDTADMIEARLDQVYDEYRERILKEERVQLNALNARIEKLRDKMNHDYTELQIEKLKNDLYLAEKKRKKKLKRKYRKFGIVGFLEEHRKLILWLAIVAFVVVMDKYRGQFDFTMKSFRIAMTSSAFGLLLIPIYSLKMGGDHLFPLPFTSLLEYRIDKLEDKDVFPKEKCTILKNYETDGENLKQLQDQSELMQQDFQEVLTMNKYKLIDYYSFSFRNTWKR